MNTTSEASPWQETVGGFALGKCGHRFFSGFFGGEGGGYVFCEASVFLDNERSLAKNFTFVYFMNVLSMFIE